MVIPTYTEYSTQPPAYSNETETTNMISLEQRQRYTELTELAVKNIERYIVADNSFPELGDRLKIRHGKLQTTETIRIRRNFSEHCFVFQEPLLKAGYTKQNIQAVLDRLPPLCNWSP